MACRPACGPAVKVYSTLSDPTMHGSKTHPLAKCQLRRVPRMLVSMLIDSFLVLMRTSWGCRFEGPSRVCVAGACTDQLKSTIHVYTRCLRLSTSDLSR